MLRYPDCKLLVTCCNNLGGLYELEFKNNHCSIRKVLEGEYRGIAIYKDTIAVVSHHAIHILNQNYQVIQSMIGESLDHHGISIHNDQLYLVETDLNRISLFSTADSFQKKGEIQFSANSFDTNHVNDLFIKGNKMYVSMFNSSDAIWRKTLPDSGVIIELDMDAPNKRRVVWSKLNQPHSVIKSNNGIYFCNSANFEVRKGNKIMFRSLGYPRGIAIYKDLLFIGQSESRHMDEGTRNRTDVPIDCGIHVFNYRQKVSHFIPLPSKEIYGVLVLERGDSF